MADQTSENPSEKSGEDRRGTFTSEQNARRSSASSSKSCPHCGFLFASTHPEEHGEIRCPNCGLSASTKSPQGGSADQIIRRYFETLWLVITKPHQFFRQMPLQGGFSGPLAFALVTHWLGSAFSFLWANIIGRWLSVYLNTFSRIAGDIVNMNPDAPNLPWEQLANLKNGFVQWFWGVGSIIVDPFYTLVSIFFTSTFVFFGAKLFASRSREVTFESALRLICYGMSPMILSGIPLFGWGLASFLSLIITVFGAKEIYRVGTGRGILIALFPMLLFFGFILAGFVFFAALISTLLSSLF
jgi:DNA-directed RNA polymerase subunit RPC12/RpoP